MLLLKNDIPISVNSPESPRHPSHSEGEFTLLSSLTSFMASEKNKKRNSSHKENTSSSERVYEDVPTNEEEATLPPPSLISITASVLRIIIFLTLIAIAWSIYQTWLPTKLSNIHGIRPTDGQTQNTPNICRLIERAIEGNYALTLTEEDINLHLRHTLLGHQDGPLGVLARYQDTAIKLHDGYAEIILIRTLGSRYKQTTSLFVTPTYQETPDGPIMTTEYVGNIFLGTLPIGGKWGRLPLPQGFLTLDIESYKKLADALSLELNYLTDPHRPLLIKKGVLIIQAPATNNISL